MATWDYYKIAEGPLDIVGKTLKVLTSESDVPIVTNNWRNAGDYWELRVSSDEPYIRETICVLDNVNLDNNYVTNGTLPLSGIFVSGNIRSISIPESEDVHQVESKYLPITPSAPNVVFNLENFGGLKAIGYARFRLSDQQEADVSISDGSVIVGVSSELLHSTSENQSDRGYLDFDRNTGKVIVHPGANRDVTTVCAVFIVAKDPDDVTNVTAISAIVTIETEGEI